MGTTRKRGRKYSFRVGQEYQLELKILNGSM